MFHLQTQESDFYRSQFLVLPKVMKLINELHFKIMGLDLMSQILNSEQELVISPKVMSKTSKIFDNLEFTEASKIMKSKVEDPLN